MVMEKEYSALWNDCLAMIRERVKNDSVFEVWFKDVTLDSYSEEDNCLVLCVPSRYVYEYLEMYCIRLLSEVIGSKFKPGVELSYSIQPHEPDFADVATWLQEHSAYDSRRDPFRIATPNAKKRMQDGLKYFLGEKAQWLDGYDKVVSWLTDNRGRGLLCVGSPGRGKSLLCKKILPVILGNGGRPIPIVNASELHDRLDELKRERILIIDDLGKEPRLHFGDPDRSFFELCNNAEQTGNLLIVTTNLSTTAMSPQHPSAHYYADSIEHRYGTEVLDRLKAITTMARLEGPSLRE